MAGGKGNRGKGNGKQVQGQQAKEANDLRLKNLNDKLQHDIDNERKQAGELKTLLQMKDGTCKELTQQKNELANKLKECTELAEEKVQLEIKWKEHNDILEELQSVKNELNETRILCERRGDLCSQLEQEKNKLENMVKECNDRIEELQGKIEEERCSWDASKIDMQTEIAKLQKKLDSVVNEKKMLTKKHEDLCTKHRNDKIELRNCNEGAQRLKAKMDEEKKLWDSSKLNLEGEIIQQKNEIDELRKLSKTNEELCTQLAQEKDKMEKDLEEIIDSSKKLNAQMNEDKKMWEGRVAGLLDELNETKSLAQKQENLSRELRQENSELENKLKESDDENKELKTRVIENVSLWNSSKAELEGTFAELQSELNETRLKHEELCIQIRYEKKHLEEKLKELDDENKKLKAKMAEDKSLWDSSKTELECTVAELQNKLSETGPKHDEFYVQLNNEIERMEEKLKDLEYKNKELHATMTENASLWNTCKANLEETIAKLQNEVNESRVLSQKNQLSSNEIGQEKTELVQKLKESTNGSEEFKKTIAEDGCNESEEFKEKRDEDELDGSEELKEKMAEDDCNGSEKLKEKVAEDGCNGSEGLKEKMVEDGCNGSEELKEKMAEDDCNGSEKLKEKVAEDGCNGSEGLKEKMVEDGCNGSEELKEKMAEDGCKVSEGLKGTMAENRLNGSEEPKREEMAEDVCNGSEELKEKMAEDGCFGKTCEGELEDKIAKLENEVKEARQEKNEFENKMEQCNDIIKNMEKEILKLQDKLDNSKDLIAKVTEEKIRAEVKYADFEKETLLLRELSGKHQDRLGRDKVELRNQVKELNDINEQLQRKILEDGLSFEACKVELKGRVAELEATREMIEQFYGNLRQEKRVLEKNLKAFDRKRKEYQNELNKTSLQREQKSGFQRKLEEYWDRFKDSNSQLALLNSKLGLLESWMDKLGGNIPRPSYERRSVSQEEPDELRSHSTDERSTEEHNLNEGNDRNDKYHAKANECNERKTCKGDFDICVEISVKRPNARKQRCNCSNEQ